MTILVKHVPTDKVYIFLGIGYGMSETMPDWKVGMLTVGNKVENSYAPVFVCDEDGNMGWLEFEEVKIFSVDNKSPKMIFESIDNG